jgi:hypothetical protein
MAIYKKLPNNAPVTDMDVHTSNKHVSYNETIYIPHVTEVTLKNTRLKI